MPKKIHNLNIKREDYDTQEEYARAYHNAYYKMRRQNESVEERTKRLERLKEYNKVYSKSDKCKVSHKISAKKYYENNKEKLNKRSREYALAHREEMKEKKLQLKADAEAYRDLKTKGLI